MAVDSIDFGIDEGGGDDLLIISAQFGDTESLRVLHTEWQRELDLRGLKYWHSVDFESIDHGVFAEAGIGKADRSVLLTRLVDLIYEHFHVGVSVHVRESAYRERTVNAFRSVYGSAYSHGVKAAFLTSGGIIRKWCDELGAEYPAVNLLIEEGRSVDHVIAELNDLKKENWFLRVSSIGAGPKQGNPILQAADILAYAEWQRVNDMPHPILQELMTNRETGYRPYWVDGGTDAAIDTMKDGYEDSFTVGKRSLRFRKASVRRADSK